MMHSATRYHTTRIGTLFVCDGCHRRVRTFANDETSAIPPRNWTARDGMHNCEMCTAKTAADRKDPTDGR